MKKVTKIIITSLISFLILNPVFSQEAENQIQTAVQTEENTLMQEDSDTEKNAESNIETVDIKDTAVLEENQENAETAVAVEGGTEVSENQIEENAVEEVKLNVILPEVEVVEQTDEERIVEAIVEIARESAVVETPEKTQLSEKEIKIEEARLQLVEITEKKSADFKYRNDAAAKIADIEKLKAEIINLRNFTVENLAEDNINENVETTEKRLLRQLTSAYNELESTTFVANSFTDDISIITDYFNTGTGNWGLSVRASLFGVPKIFKHDCEVSYTQITGKKMKSVKKMNTPEAKEFNEIISFYNGLFHTETPAFGVKLYYKIKKWSWASQYRFEPVKCEIFRIDNKGTILCKLTADELEKVIFKVAPELEVRTEDEILKEQKVISSILAAEEKEAAKKAWVESQKTEEGLVSTTGAGLAAKNSVSDKSTPQKGRTGVYAGITAKAGEGQIKNFSKDTLKIDSVYLNAFFPLGKFGFIGIDSELYIPVPEEAPHFEAGLSGGANVMITRYVRPFIKGSLGLDNDINMNIKAGFGADFIIVKFASISMGLDYNWRYDLAAQYNLMPRTGNEPTWVRNHVFYLGAGVAW